MSTSARVVTTFSDQGYELYGRSFIETFLENWNIPLTVYHEDLKPPIKGPKYIPLKGNKPLERFQGEFGFLPASKGVVGKKDGKWVVDYRTQCAKFAPKVFAVCAEMERTRDVDWLIWIDADVETRIPVTERLLSTVCPSMGLLSYLGREEWDHSECGFVAYRVGHPVPRAFLKRFREIYMTGEVFKYRQWHDSYIFDRVIDEFEPWKPFFLNISSGIPGNHVWPDTVLGEYMTHHKGPEAKNALRPAE